MFSPFHAKNSQNIDHKEDTKEWEVFLNTEVEEVQSTLQLSSDLGMLPSTCQGRVCAKVTENRAKDFLAFLHECSLLLGHETDESFFRKKIF